MDKDSIEYNNKLNEINKYDNEEKIGRAHV
jgi:hypothetical protein